MTLEKKLIDKKYYEGYIKDRTELPIEVLGKLYITEQSKNIPDLTSIRFAQGELYFQYQDYETAIFKWENINNELEPWAKKNLADAYMALGELSTAESIYKAIVSDSDLLNVEISLQLFALYIEKSNHEMALETIKQLILIHPDYNNMTMLARSYFEEQAYWNYAIELAVKEGIRTESLKWYDALIKYADLGVTAKYEPAYFLSSLNNVQKLDQQKCEQLAISLCKNYKKTNHYLTWLKEFNQLLSKFPSDSVRMWSELPSELGKTYLELISGAYPLKDIEEIAPLVLSNFFMMAEDEQGIIAASYILAWNDMFPFTIDSNYVEKAEKMINETAGTNVDFEQFIELFKEILNWADNHDIRLDKKFAKKFMEYIPSEAVHLLIIGSSGNGVNDYINELIGETILSEETTSLVTIKDNDYLEIKEVTDDNDDTIDNLSNFYDELLTSNNHAQEVRVYELNTPSSYLHDNNWAVSTAPFYQNDSYAEYVLLADSLVYVMNDRSLFQYNEYEKLLEWQEKVPHLTIQFLIYVEEVENEKVATKRLQKATSTIQHYFPASKIFIYSKQEDRNYQLTKISSYYQRHFAERGMVEERTAKSISIIQDLITNLLDKRVEMEDSLRATLTMYEEIVSKLTGASNQLTDMELEKAKTISAEFMKVKENVTQQMMEEIPKMLKSCKDMVKEDSDFGNIHVVLNDEMNKRINQYVQHTLLPSLHNQITVWIERSEQELRSSQSYMQELCEGFNVLYENNQVELSCDFSVLDDWKRDARRMTSGITIDHLNILLRLKPSQVLLKSAGKLFGSIPQNKKILYAKYQKLLETEDFSEVASTVVQTFTVPFDFFEKGIDRDVSMFFKNPQNVLKQTIGEKVEEIKEYKSLLEKLKNNPEMFHDPLRLFELQLLQYDWLTNTPKLATAGVFQEEK
ncbi:tetratricopeptide repeat protein [Niallia sp. 03133]|uniref:tetratricopeptide repeat protein n=1 Tax=Niallia sp. 03133 TaxID=3458060 RepID=UPI004043FAEE